MISIIIAEDHTIVREGFRSLLEATSDIKVVGEAKNGKIAVNLCQELKPDIILMDIAMPTLNGIEAARLITRDVPETKVIMLSMYSDEEYVHESLLAGALGYLVKETASEDLIKAIYEINEGKCYLSPIISKTVLTAYKKIPFDFFENTNSDPEKALTDREREIVQLIAEGYTTRQIAEKLYISNKTVGNHRQHIGSKLDIHDIAGLTRYAIDRGIIPGKRY